jgi:hypothetical protein
MRNFSMEVIHVGSHATERETDMRYSSTFLGYISTLWERATLPGIQQHFQRCGSSFRDTTSFSGIQKHFLGYNNTFWDKAAP